LGYLAATSGRGCKKRVITEQTAPMPFCFFFFGIFLNFISTKSGEVSEQYLNEYLNSKAENSNSNESVSRYYSIQRLRILGMVVDKKSTYAKKLKSAEKA